MRNDGYEVVYMFSCSINEVGILFAKRKSNKKKIKRKFHNRKPR
jgi:transcription antitermination factor NusA-like protein